MRKKSLNCVLEMARRDPRVVFIGSDLGVGTLEEFRREMPERFFMEGVAEQNIIGMAAGLALEGFIPYVNTIATFLTRRCYEQVAVDLCYHNLPVRLIANGGGLVYAPLGPTHLAIEDMGIMRALPNMTVLAPADAAEMGRLVPQTLDVPGPVYIRLGKGGDPVVTPADDQSAIGQGVVLRRPGRCLFIATGIMSGRALAAAELLGAQGLACGVLHLPTVKPLDEAKILELTTGVEAIFTVEEHVLPTGLGSAVSELLIDRRPGRVPPLYRFGIPDRFPDRYGSQDELLDYFNLSPAQLAARALRLVGKQAA